MNVSVAACSSEKREAVYQFTQPKCLICFAKGKYALPKPANCHRY
jgi:hypothetical protein